MAKWEERDPRWLVEERPDATNVNNWHWTNKDASHWSKIKLEELLIGLKIESDFGYCTITEMSKCEGSADVTNRKGRLILFYEWNLQMKWYGVTNSGAVIEGKVTVLDFTEECDVKNLNIEVHFEADEEDAERLGNLMHFTGRKVIQSLLAKYDTALKEDFGKDQLLPTHGIPDVKLSTFSKTSQKCQLKESIAKMEPDNNNNNIQTQDFHSTEIFKCTAEELYRIFTVKELVEAFTQSDCILEPKEGGNFELFGGNVDGYFVELIPSQKIRLKWRFSRWPKEHFSDVDIVINQQTDFTELKFSQYGIPEEELENAKSGWKKYYWDSIRKTFGFGSFLF